MYVLILKLASSAVTLTKLTSLILLPETIALFMYLKECNVSVFLTNKRRFIFVRKLLYITGISGLLSLKIKTGISYCVILE